MPEKRTVMHPTREGVFATYGWEASGFYITLESHGCSREHDERVQSPHLADILAVFVEWGFFGATAPSLALKQLTVWNPDEIDDPELAMCARVIVGLRRAAD